MAEKVRVGVIGLGMGQLHAERYRDCPGAELVALCDSNEARLHDVASRNYAWRTYTLADEVLADPDVQAVSIAVPNSLHYPMTMQALAAGKHVMCEKPLAMNAQQAEEMVAESRRRNLRLMVHFNNRFTATAQAVKRAIDAGAVGDIYFSRAVWHRKRGIPNLGSWFTQKSLSGGGALIDLGVHRLDLALYFMGYPRPVSVSGATYNHLGKELGERQAKPFDVEDLATGYIRFENGATLVLEASWASNSEKKEDQLVQVFGTKGGALIRNWDEEYQFEARLFHGAGDEVTVEHPCLWDHDETAQAHFCRALQEGFEPSASGEQGVVVMRLLDALYESARTGAEVRL